MKRILKVFIGILLILIGLAGIATYQWNITAKNLTAFEHKWTFTAEELRQLHISSDLKLELVYVRSTDGTNSIELEGYGTKNTISHVVDTAISNHKLKLDLGISPSDWLNFVSFLNFNQYNVTQRMIITVSEDVALDSLHINVNTGSMTLKDAALLQIDQATIAVDAGNMTIDNFKANHLKATVNAGSITGNNIQADMDLSVNAGSLVFKDTIGPAVIRVDVGNAKIYKLDTANLDLVVNVGNALVHLPSQFAGDFDLDSDIGKITSPAAKKLTNDIIRARVDVGNITIEQE
ncbi:MAG: DUF4097 family beta strand repeat-containing protein [Candidatus Cohnella colombiensis]|uniref:DUF4097 family beta strand repeat-containing protein n=1 Tax=Candidatus Cohnella colombiensis TaxID=3121368 RepID=A0AA95F3C2_9BACL|nr:MAG: DUF4097 family beta strand repeat-containing protein [Cohnella sp.]